MLNYIWFILIILGIGTAVYFDVSDKVNDKYKNGEAVSISITSNENLRLENDKPKKILIGISSSYFNSFYNTSEQNNISQPAQISYDKNKNEYPVFVKVDEKTPQVWKTIAKASGDADDFTGNIYIDSFSDSSHAQGRLITEKVNFLKMKQVTAAILDYAKTAVNISLGLIGIMALWLGILKIAEEAGVIKLIASSVKPVTKFLFPEVPADHPAMGAIIMNISANILGLGNAATPFGIKAMEELDKLNPEKGTATNAMCTFLAINTAGLTLIPTTAIAIRAAAGSSDPAIIIGTSFFGASCATITGIAAAKMFEKFSRKDIGVFQAIKRNFKKMLIAFLFLFLIAVGITTGLFSEIVRSISFIDTGVIRSIVEIVALLTIPALVLLFVGIGIIKKVKIYEVFTDGAKEGFNVAVRIIPYLVAMLVAIGIFREGGAMDILTSALGRFTSLIGLPAEALPMVFMRPLSGSGSLGIMTDIMKVHGPDSFIGILVSTIMGSTETTLYVLAVYFGAVNIRKTRHAVAAGLLADAAGILGALFIVRLLFG